MIHITMSPFIEHLRVYSVPDGYAKRLPYDVIVTVVHLSDTWVYIGAAVGVINMQTWDAAMDLLRAKGVETIQYERHGRMKTRKIKEKELERGTD
jgi:hypothetical protein